MMPISLHEAPTLERVGYPRTGPVGSVYQPTAYFPTKEQRIPMTPLPPASNFKAQEFPVSIYDRQIGGFGNPLDVYAPNLNTGSR